MAITVGDAISPALNRAGLVLFRPFKLKNWLVLAIAPALMLVGEGLSPLVNLGVQFGMRFLPQMTFEQWLQWIQMHMAQLLGGTVGIIAVTFPIYLWMRCVNARGYLIFYDNLVLNEARVKIPWKDFRRLGNSLMKMCIWWDLIWFNVLLVIAVLGASLEWPDFKHWLLTNEYQPTGWTTAAVVFVVAAAIVAMPILWFIRMVGFKLAVPVMYIRRMEAWPAVKLAWRELYLPHKGACIRYFLFFIVVEMVRGPFAAIGMIILAVVTLCLAYVIFYLPVLGNYPLALAVLPVTVFDAAYQLHFLSQFGPEYQVPWHEEIRDVSLVILDSPPESSIPGHNPLP